MCPVSAPSHPNLALIPKWPQREHGLSYACEQNKDMYCSRQKVTNATSTTLTCATHFILLGRVLSGTNCLILSSLIAILWV